jgi:hypothetical protein
MQFIRDLVAGGHNIWAKCPVALQAILLVILGAIWTYTTGYNWQIPAGFVLTDTSTWHLLVTIGGAYAIGVYAIVRQYLPQLWSAIVPELLKLLKLEATPYMSPVASAAGTLAEAVMLQSLPYDRNIVLWTKAA